MSNSASHAALPYPIRKARFSIAVPFLDSSGTPTDPTTPDTEVSLDGGAFADCAEEVTTISGSNGMGYITLTGAETDCSLLTVAAKVASGPKATLLMGTPRVLAIVGSGTLSAGSAGGGTLGTLLAYDVTGCFIRTTGGTGGGGTGGANNQARKIVTYNTGTGAFTVSPNWETTVSTDTTYDVLLPENVTLGMLKALNPATPGRTLVVDAAGLGDANTVKVGPTGSGTAQTARDLGASVLLSAGTGTGQVALSSGAVTVGTNNDKTGYTASTVSDKTGYTLTSGYDAAKTAAQAGDAMALTSGERNTLAASIWNALTSGMTTAGSIAKRIIDFLTGDVYARLGAPTGASHAADVAAVKTDTAAIKAKTDNLPSSPAATGDCIDAAGVRTAVGLASANLDAQLTDIANGVTTVSNNLGDVGGIPGSGADSVTLNFKDAGAPIADADVWVTTDSAGTHVVAGTLQTDSSGNATFLLDAGNTYYAWMQKDGENPVKGESFVAVAD